MSSFRNGLDRVLLWIIDILDGKQAKKDWESMKRGTYAGLHPLIIPAIMAVTSIAGSVLKNKAAGKSAEEQAQLYNDWLRLRQAGVNDIMAAAQAKGYDPFGPQITTRNDTGTQSTTTDSTTEQTQNPFLTPEYAALGEKFRALAEARLDSPTALPAGYEQSGVRKINTAAAGPTQQLRNEAARRGISADTFLLASPVERQRQGSIADFLTQVPLQERAMRTEDINLAAGLARVFGLGQYSKSRTRGNSTTNSSSNSTVTSPPNLGQLASWVLPESPLASRQTGQSTSGDLLSGLSQLYFSNPGYFNNMFGQGGGTPGAATGDGYFDDNGNWVPARR